MLQNVAVQGGQRPLNYRLLVLWSIAARKRSGGAGPEWRDSQFVVKVIAALPADAPKLRNKLFSKDPPATTVRGLRRVGHGSVRRGRNMKGKLTLPNI